ncbi:MULTISPECIES: ATP-binding protein [Pirellulaceae]|nr:MULTISPECIES: ATP-binding protein [Pirellulaceae]RCS50286.1 DUF4435 domain-containing protein [Bremerella cremea]
MYIKHLNIRKYRHIEGLEIGPFSAPRQSSDLIVFAGPNGSGKSSVLELISQTLATSWSLTYSVNRTAPESSFEVCIGLLPSEIELIKTISGGGETEAFEYLDQHRSYYRSFKFEGGEYDKNQVLHNKIHNLVTKSLKGDYYRPLGFYLGPERSFKKENYDYAKKLFQYQQYIQPSYVSRFAFQREADQFADMLDFLIAWRHDYILQLGAYSEAQRNANVSEDELPPYPEDTYGNVLSKVFPNYSFVRKPESAPSDLFIRIPSGETIPFSDLSSGEKQVFFTLCFFERHNVEDAIIMIDEPELHLHPSLARVLLRTMQQLKSGNQIWLATQSADVIDEAGRDRVWFIQRENKTKKAEIIRGTDEEPALSCLRDFFGYSGYIGLAKAMIFTEGHNSSADRKMFSRLFPQHSKEIKFIPASGCSEIERINRSVLSLLEADVAFCKFFLIRDRDYMPDEMVRAIEARSGDKIHVLKRHEIENYLLDDDIISVVLEELFHQQLSPDQVGDELKAIACKMAGDVLRDMVSFRLNYKFRPEDFTVAKLFKEAVSFDPLSNSWNGKDAELKTALSGKAGDAVSELNQRLSGHDFDDLYESCREEIRTSLVSGNWNTLFPGKELLRNFAKKLSIGQSPYLENAIIKEMSIRSEKIPTELSELIEKFIKD